ncbi:hypothetical protein PVT01_000019900 [Plasmodium vivax]|uniref:VIR protein n=1 Tax=Plasmodium vivax TaxID=5855 RepID=A0A1G4E607_PLAVI|nr:hypothetical protein PVT01_000019900 [Plasmodium vivax]
MTVKDTNNTYFNYKDYDETKEYFLRKLKSNNEYKVEFFEQAFSELKGKSEYANLFRDIFIKLQKLLNQDGILGFEGKEKGCKYINFVLNKDLTKFNSIIYNEATFQLFKDFEDKFRREKGRTNHICDLQYERLPHTNALESLESQSPSRIEPAKETFSPKGPLQSTETQDNLVTLHTTEEEQSIEVLKPTGFVSPYREQSTLKAKAKPHEENTQNLMHIKGQYYPELSSHQRVLEFPNIENETVDKGYLRTVRDAVSGFMEGVDPVPVVGVSGGMGALFLLFRYTPVGTFFRGRGRRQGIPTRFDGVYTGFMTDFQGDGFFPNNQYNIAYGAE